MPRFLVTLVVLLGCVPFASAHVVPPRGDASPGVDLSRQYRHVARAPEAKHELVITSETEIQVDGQGCRLDQVPAGAEIILIDVAADRSVVRRLHFRTKK
jgi:hypothetical protein